MNGARVAIRECVRSTLRAVLLRYEDASGEEVERWVPRSVIEDGDVIDDGDEDFVIRIRLRWADDLEMPDLDAEAGE